MTAVTPTNQIDTVAKKPLSPWFYVALVVIVLPFVALFGITKYQGYVIVKEINKVDQLSLFSSWDGSFNAKAQGNALCLDQCTAVEETFYAQASNSTEELRLTLQQFLENQGYTSVNTMYTNTGRGVIASGTKGKLKISITVNDNGGYSRATVSY